MTDLANAWLNAYVAEPDLARLRLGQEAEVVTDDGQRRKGRVSFVASRAEFTPKNVQTRDERVKLVYRIKVALENRGRPLQARHAGHRAPAAGGGPAVTDATRRTRSCASRRSPAASAPSARSRR